MDRIEGRTYSRQRCSSRCSISTVSKHWIYRPVPAPSDNFNWKTLGAGSEIAKSLTVAGNNQVPATRRSTHKMADATASGRTLVSNYPTIGRLSQRYTDILLCYRQLFLYDDADFTSPRGLNEPNACDRVPFIKKPPSGCSGSSSARSRSALALYRILLKDNFSH